MSAIGPEWLQAPNSIEFYTHMLKEHRNKGPLKSWTKALRKFDGQGEAAFIDQHFRKMCLTSNFGEWASSLARKNNRRFCPIVHEIIASRYRECDSNAQTQQLVSMLGVRDRKAALDSLISSRRDRTAFVEALTTLASEVPDLSPQSRWKLELRSRLFEVVQEYELADRMHVKITQRDLELYEYNRGLRRVKQAKDHSPSEKEAKLDRLAKAPSAPSASAKRSNSRPVALPAAAMIVIRAGDIVDFQNTVSTLQSRIAVADTLYLASVLSHHDRWRLALAHEITVSGGMRRLVLTALSVDIGERFMTIGLYTSGTRLHGIVRLPAEEEFSPAPGSLDSLVVATICYLFSAPERLVVSHASGDVAIASKTWGSNSPHSALYRPNGRFLRRDSDRVVTLGPALSPTVPRESHDVRGYIQDRRGKPVRVRGYRTGGSPRP